MQGALTLAIIGLLALAGSALAADANEPFCANESLVGFSAGLPDCRAYEVVSPRFENGFDAIGTVAATADGSHLLASSVASFAGAESNTLGPTYSITRGPQHWETEAISPPAAAFPANVYYAASANLDKSVWAMRAPTQSIYSQDLYLRESDRSFVKVGSMVPPSSQVGPVANGYQVFLGFNFLGGASSDLSHLYFYIVNGIAGSSVWPGDTTVSFATGANAFSLYEYVGVGNAVPKLVGVDGQGHLISDCATYLGSEERRDVYNAISADGRRAYFTAQGHNSVNCTGEDHAPVASELYARLDGSESVPISEPRESDCEQCKTATRAPAEFWGASADGTKAFFTTTQELLAGNESTNLYMFDFNASRGARIMRVSRGIAAPEVQGVARVSEDGSHVYFVARGRLTNEPRGGLGGDCLASESSTEKAEEQAAEEKAEELGGRCRAKSGAENLYVFEHDDANPGGRLAFVATLAEGDESDWRSEDSRPVQATSDGRDLVFQSGNALTPDVTGEAPQVYEYDALTEELIRVSRGQSLFPQGTANANSSFAVIPAQSFSAVLRPTDANTRLAISADGASVLFQSPAALTEGAVEAAEHGASQIYEYQSSGKISNGDVFLLSGGHNQLSARIEGLDQAGRNAFYATADQLSPIDTNTGFDLYDARVAGGFEKRETPTCTGEGCLEALAVAGVPQLTPGTLGVTPEPPTPASPLPAGPGRVITKPASGLAKALKACRRDRRRATRIRCERNARKRFAGNQRVKHASVTSKASAKLKGPR